MVIGSLHNMMQFQISQVQKDLSAVADNAIANLSFANLLSQDDPSMLFKIIQDRSAVLHYCSRAGACRLIGFMRDFWICGGRQLDQPYDYEQQIQADSSGGLTSADPETR